MGPNSVHPVVADLIRPVGNAPNATNPIPTTLISA